MKKTILGAIAAMVFAATVATPASAQNLEAEIRPKSEYPAEVVSLVEKALDGPLSDIEADMLKSDYPELAAVIPDYRKNETELTRLSAPLTSTLSSDSGCAYAAGTHHSKTLLGFTFYNMHTSVRFCWSKPSIWANPEVTSVTNLETTFTDISSYAQIGQEIERTMNTGAYGFARHKYLVINEIPNWGTWNTKYPENNFTMYPGGEFIHGHRE